jgi:hypothetical protein
MLAESKPGPAINSTQGHTQMRKYTKYIVAAGAIAALAVPSVASATVSVDANGFGSIGKGDVQTALGYANDAAFQNDAKNITFSLAPSTVHYVATHYCSAQSMWSPGDPPMDQYQSDMGTIGTVSNTPNVQATKSGAGKVTGYVATGITTAASPLDYSQIDWSKWSTCPAGEHFMGWIDPANAFSTVTVPGSSVLQVSNGLRTVALPNTPIS